MAPWSLASVIAAPIAYRRKLQLRPEQEGGEDGVGLGHADGVLQALVCMNMSSLHFIPARRIGLLI